MATGIVHRITSPPGGSSGNTERAGNQLFPAPTKAQPEAAARGLAGLPPDRCFAGDRSGEASTFYRLG